MKSWWWGLALATAGASRAQEWTCRELPSFALRAQSSHFCLFWNDSAKVSPAAADSSLQALEGWWDFLVGGGRFPEPQPERVPRLRTSVFVLEQGWALGGMDGGSPALWFAPGALRDPWALGHEFAQSLQASTGGFEGSPFAGWFRDGFANWLTFQRMDTASGCAELYRRQVQIHYGSSRNRFCNWPFLEFLKDRHGYAHLDSLWTRWPGRMPRAEQDVLGRIQEELGLDDDGLADEWGTFALHVAATDFTRRAVFLKAWEERRPEQWQRLDRIELEAVDTALGRYAVPASMAPQAFAFDVVPLHEASDTVRIRFQGLVQPERPAWSPLLRTDPDTLPVPGSAWRWGVNVIDTGVPAAPSFRYLGPFSGSSGEAVLSLSRTETASLVVAATPSPRPRILWDQSHRSLYRYPWRAEIRGARPEGWQAARANPAGEAGSRHGNGGGFVAATAHVDPTAWVGPQAQVLEEAQVLGSARVEDRAIVKGQATVRDRARVREWARVWGRSVVRDRADVSGHAVLDGGSVRDSARVDGFATIQWDSTSLAGAAHLGGTALDLAPARLSGTVQVVGDAELWGVQASAGVFTGLVDAAAIGDPARGAALGALPPEATAVFPTGWGATGLPARPGSSGLEARIRRQGTWLEIDRLPPEARCVHLTSLAGRRLATGLPSEGKVRFPDPPGGLLLVVVETRDGNLTGRTVEP